MKLQVVLGVVLVIFSVHAFGGKPEGEVEALVLSPQSSDNDDLEKLVIDNFLENRDRLESCVLSWTRTVKDNGFGKKAGRAIDNLEYGGSYQLWWDGKKTTTKYTTDKICSGTENSGMDDKWWIEKESGGHTYGGHLLSAKPRYTGYENWLQQVARWDHPMSLDKGIKWHKKQDYIKMGWSLVEQDGVKLVKLTAENIESRKGIEKGAYSVEFFDALKNYSLISREWYDGSGRLYMKETRRYKEVVPGLWFPGEVNYQSFGMDGKAELSQRLVLNLDQCRFNDPKAVSEEVFGIPLPNEQAKFNLQKHVPQTMEIEVKQIYETLYGWWKTAAERDYEQHAEYVMGPKSRTTVQIQNSIAELHELMQFNPDWSLLLVSVHWDDNEALAVADKMPIGDPKVGSQQVLVFTLKKQNNRWLIHDIDLEELNGLQIENSRFLKDHPDAQTWYIEPGPENTPSSTRYTRTLLPSIRMVLDLTTGKIIEVPIETKTQAECLAYAQQHCGCGIMFDHDGDISHLGFINIKSVNRHTELKSGIEMMSFVSKNVPQAMIVTAEDGKRYSVRIQKAENEGCTLEFEQIHLKELDKEIKMSKRLESAAKMRTLGSAMHVYLFEYDGIYPARLDKEFADLVDIPYDDWLANDVQLLVAGEKEKKERANKIPIAYDKALLDSDSGTHVLFADGHVEFRERKNIPREFNLRPKNPYLQGRVFDPDGKPIADAIVQIRQKREPGMTSIRAPNVTTDEHGYYWYDGIDWPYMVGALRVTAKDNGQVRYSQYIGERYYYDKPETVDIHFDTEFPKGDCTLQGEVIGPDGNVMTDFVVRVVNLPDWKVQPPKKIHQYVLQKRFNNDQGHYEITGLPEGTHCIKVLQFDENAPAPVHDNRFSDQTVDLMSEKVNMCDFAGKQPTIMGSGMGGLGGGGDDSESLYMKVRKGGVSIRPETNRDRHR